MINSKDLGREIERLMGLDESTFNDKKCSCCGNPLDNISYNVTDDVWMEVSKNRKTSGPLCLECIDKMLKDLGHDVVWEPKFLK